MIQDHYLAVKRWSLSFNPREPCFDHTMVWIRFSSLNMMYYEKNSMKAIVAVVGKPIKVNLTTQRVERGRYTLAWERLIWLCLL